MNLNITLFSSVRQILTKLSREGFHPLYNCSSLSDHRTFSHQFVIKVAKNLLAQVLVP